MADTQLYKLNIQIEDRASSAAKKIQDGLDGIGQKAGHAAGGVAKIGEEVRQASAVAPRFNALGMSLQQVARELPAFTYSASTGFMAISNNLPILADSIAAARRENHPGLETTRFVPLLLADGLGRRDHRADDVRSTDRGTHEAVTIHVGQLR